MSDKKMTEKELAAALEAAQAKIATLEQALATSASPAAQAAHAKAERMKELEAIRAKTKQTPDGMAHYRIKRAYYRQGNRYQPGAVVRIPVEELPSITWEPVTADSAKTAAPVAPAVPAAPPTKTPERVTDRNI